MSGAHGQQAKGTGCRTLTHSHGDGSQPHQPKDTRSVSGGHRPRKTEGKKLGSVPGTPSTYWVDVKISTKRARSWVIHQGNPESIGGVLKLLKKTITVFVISIPQTIRLAGQACTEVIHFSVVGGPFSFLCFLSLNTVNPPSCPHWVFPRHFCS